MMDAITLLMVKRNAIVLDVLFQILHLLVEKYPPCFNYESLHQLTKFVLESSPQIYPCYGDTITAYTGIIYESCLLPKIYQRQPLFQVDPNIANGSLSKLEVFHRFVQPFLRRNQALNGQRTDYVQNLLKQGFPRIKVEHTPPIVQGRPSFTSSTSSGNTTIEPLSIDSPATSPHDSNESYLSKFLSSFRRSGMDILFPQVIHDKLLLLIFVSTNILGPLTHRELIEIINQMKQTGMLAKDFQSVSKTKMRGVVTLCRNAHCLVVVGKSEGDSDSMKLSIQEDLTDFSKFRHFHDEFILTCLQQRSLHLPDAMKADILWPKEAITTTENNNADLLQQTEEQLQELFTTEKEHFLQVLKQLPPMVSPTASSSSSKLDEVIEKGNLTLHVRSQRPIGDHLLSDSHNSRAPISLSPSARIHSSQSSVNHSQSVSTHQFNSQPPHYQHEIFTNSNYSRHQEAESSSSHTGYYSLFPNSN